MGSPQQNRFRSTTDGLRRAKGSYLCRDCRSLDERPGVKSCLMCGSKNVVYFPSKAELKRGAQLLLLEAAGRITQLKFHSRHNLVVEGVHVTTYTDDASYFSDGKQIIEDTKPPFFMTDGAKLKIALFDALFLKAGLSITLVKVKS